MTNTPVCQFVQMLCVLLHTNQHVGTALAAWRKLCLLAVVCLVYSIQRQAPVLLALMRPLINTWAAHQLQASHSVAVVANAPISLAPSPARVRLQFILALKAFG